ncbi:hypothetical protein IHE45_05G000100 [Dioscorea alata]|uniref:Uncharacterized protein n=1 Tax=Dioscorea alata TaxID=55571 RepID=A0ACB7VYS1_DIOAL|nr:hypothetical protein IHE45_05G000100 [Dioscorea alata]
MAPRKRATSSSSSRKPNQPNPISHRSLPILASCTSLNATPNLRSPLSPRQTLTLILIVLNARRLLEIRFNACPALPVPMRSRSLNL